MRAVMSETATRLLTLLSLLQGRRDWPGGELADRLGVSHRTIRRDVQRLRALGYPIESLTGPAGGYQLRAGTAMPPCSSTRTRRSPSPWDCAPRRAHR
jgi:predicted DNA-binding transcriptional regulator YafY